MPSKDFIWQTVMLLMINCSGDCRTVLACGVDYDGDELNLLDVTSYKTLAAPRAGGVGWGVPWAGSRESVIGWELTKNGCNVRSPGLLKKPYICSGKTNYPYYRGF